MTVKMMLKAKRNVVRPSGWPSCSKVRNTVLSRIAPMITYSKLGLLTRSRHIRLNAGNSSWLTVFRILMVLWNDWNLNASFHFFWSSVTNSARPLSYCATVYESTMAATSRLSQKKEESTTKKMKYTAAHHALFSCGCLSLPAESIAFHIMLVQPSPAVTTKSDTSAWIVLSKLYTAVRHTGAPSCTPKRGSGISILLRDRQSSLSVAARSLQYPSPPMKSCTPRMAYMQNMKRPKMHTLVAAGAEYMIADTTIRIPWSRDTMRRGRSVRSMRRVRKAFNVELCT
mmetsp:Transcript_23025/g.78425  ORF Transcript_23025/g.78425 Transcript_23025/m.78425 type:complete len:285 (+) Transcript_23025:1551-2405(+)